MAFDQHLEIIAHLLLHIRTYILSYMKSFRFIPITFHATFWEYAFYIMGSLDHINPNALGHDYNWSLLLLST